MSEFEEYMEENGKENRGGASVEDSENQKNAMQDPTTKLFSNNGSVELPPDIAEVWGGDPNAVLFIREWGLDAFRGSKLHQMAVVEHERQRKLGPLRQNYVKKQQKK